MTIGTRQELRAALEDKLCAHFGVSGDQATDQQVFCACAILLREWMSRRLALEEPEVPRRQVHYLSMEFLLGRSLEKNAFNMGILEPLAGALEDMGKCAADIFEEEPDAGLGNGGLGRLAACYMDSLSTREIPATGYSLCYELGIFRQRLREGRQTEEADNWLEFGENWLVTRYEDAVEIRFGGRVNQTWDYFGNCHAELQDYTTVLAVPRDMLISGYGTDHVNTLRLWEAKSPNYLDMYLFSSGRYVESMEQRTMAEVITKILYPADDHNDGKVLRLKQQYFFVSATIQDILRKHVARFGGVGDFAERHVIQINDTHPALVIPELMRLLMDDHGLGWDAAWDIVTRTVAYTNHTVLSEALEKWPQGLVQTLLPRVWEILCEIDRRWRKQLMAQFGENRPAVERSLIIRDGNVHMANLCLSACFAINGVSALHGAILRDELFRDHAAIQPERFTYVTNGIDHRRWLAQCNPGLHSLICELLGGDGYLRNPEELAGLERFRDDSAVLRRLEMVKAENKARFAAWLRRQGGPALDTGAIFDVQVKRLHEYKRQLLCAMLITHLRQRIHDNPQGPFQPRTFLFGAKAASGYAVAKRIIRLLCSLMEETAQDPLCRGRLQVVFLENYRVSMAEKLMPAAQVSEQISTAGKEASGTGNMKLMMNGAVTIGTLDGANVEMHERLGDENMFLFGLHNDEVRAWKAAGYDPSGLVAGDARIERVLQDWSRGFHDGESYADLASRLRYGGDEFMLLADFASYVDCHDRLYAAIADPETRARMSLSNIARSGVFAADRAIEEYARRIWRL